MPSTLLYHGPGAFDEALNECHRQGRLLAPPFGENGLKVAEAKEVVKLLSSIPVGIERGVVLVGPMDLASSKSSDTLLKITEDFHEMVQPILWAHDLGSVSETIRSRCLPRWAPSIQENIDEEIEEAGRAILQAFSAKQLWEIPQRLGERSKHLPELIGVVADGIAMDPSEENLLLWSRLRPVLKYRNPTLIEITSAFLGE